MTNIDHAGGTYHVTDDDRAAIDFADRADALAMNKRFIARLRQKDPQSDQLATWIKFGEHGQLWQWRHWRERPDRKRRDP